VIDPTPFYLRLAYDARAGRETCTALCEIAYPHRLRWPLLGRLIEMSFDRAGAWQASIGSKVVEDAY
jgi:hypothetical protein